MRGEDLDTFTPIAGEFALEDVDREAMAERFGVGALKSGTIVCKRQYDGKGRYDFDADENRAIAHVIETTSLRADLKTEAGQATTFDALREIISAFEKRTGEPEVVQAAEALKGRIAAVLGDKPFRDAVMNSLIERLPLFFYYANYSTLPYTVDIKQLLNAKLETLDDNELTALSLLRMAGADNEYLLNPDYERRKRELENVANALTDDVLHYWTQNPDLRVTPDITQQTILASNGQQSVVDQLKIRIWDQRHFLSLPFDEHSTGFQWFFSFLAAFSEYEIKNHPVIILLDEPALGLHARAQADFLRFIQDRLAKRCQVLYSTHSPFMVQTNRLECVRVVEDRGREEGSRISADVFTVDRDTLFPLQGALGYDLAQHLFIAPHNLVVEGTSDYAYIATISDFLRNTDGRAFLDDRWSVLPVGGVDMVPTFVALLGQHLEVTVLIDAQKAGHQRLSNLAAAGYLSEKRILTVGEITGTKLADIEDLFDEGDYLMLYNRAFGTKIKKGSLVGTDPIVSRICRHSSLKKYDHGRVADVLLRNRTELLPKLSNKTLENFEKLFIGVNETLGTNSKLGTT